MTTGPFSFPVGEIPFGAKRSYSKFTADECAFEEQPLKQPVSTSGGPIMRNLDLRLKLNEWVLPARNVRLVRLDETRTNMRGLRRKASGTTPEFKLPEG